MLYFPRQEDTLHTTISCGIAMSEGKEVVSNKGAFVTFISFCSIWLLLMMVSVSWFSSLSCYEHGNYCWMCDASIPIPAHNLNAPLAKMFHVRNQSTIRCWLSRSFPRQSFCLMSTFSLGFRGYGFCWCGQRWPWEKLWRNPPQKKSPREAQPAGSPRKKDH